MCPFKNIADPCPIIQMICDLCPYCGGYKGWSWGIMRQVVSSSTTFSTMSWRCPTQHHVQPSCQTAGEWQLSLWQYYYIRIPSAWTYRYLGIVFSLTGSYTAATDELRKKGFKAYFALKNLLQLDALSVNAVFELFDALIVPVVANGCQTGYKTLNLLKA